MKFQPSSFSHEPDFVSLGIVQRQVNDTLLLISVDLYVRFLRNKVLIGRSQVWCVKHDMKPARVPSDRLDGTFWESRCIGHVVSEQKLKGGGVGYKVEMENSLPD